MSELQQTNAERKQPPYYRGKMLATVTKTFFINITDS